MLDKRSCMISIENALTSLYESGDISQAFLNKSHTLTAWYLCVPFFQVMFNKKETLILLKRGKEAISTNPV